MCNERTGCSHEVVGGPLSGVNEACAAAQETLAEVNRTLKEKVNPAIDSLKAVADDIHSMLAQLKAILPK